MADAESDDSTVLDPVAAAAAMLDDDEQRRYWLRALLPFVQARRCDSDPSGRVQLALDLMQIAVCERITRLCNCDLQRGIDGRTDY
jgi:hypothetical protein